MNPEIQKFIKVTRNKLDSNNLKRSEENKFSSLIHAAVLIPITCIEEELVVLFTKRTGFVKNHQNQISFPGGKIEIEDLNPLSAALRENHEEIGIPVDDIEVIGALEPRNTSTGFYVYPFIGFIHNLDQLGINPTEVEKIIYIPLKWLQDPCNSHYELYQGKSTNQHSVLFYSQYEGDLVWGITASLIKDFILKIK
jgi:8-oxo-dGTP pyrophosphatase MutT (NUDIX family)